MNIFAHFKTLLFISLLPLNQAGLKRTIASERGKVVIVNMWATWCAPCKAEMPALVSFERQHAGQKVKLILLSANEPEEKKAAETFLERSGFGSAAYIKQDKDDQQFINSVDPTWSGALPATFVYDRSGKLVKSFFGTVDMNELEALIRTLSTS
jgi:thiol-disulfide isomerase/thioredoxin